MKRILTIIVLGLFGAFVSEASAQSFAPRTGKLVIGGNGGTDLTNTLTLTTTGVFGAPKTYTFPVPSLGLFHSTAGGLLSLSLVDLTADVTNILGGANGGTGVNNGTNTLTYNNTLNFNLTGPTTVTLPTSGIILTSTTTAGGDLSGTYPAPTVAKINGNTIPVNAAGALINNGTGTLTWTGVPTGSGTVSGTNTGDVTLAGENYLTIAAQVITAHAIDLTGTNVTGQLKAGSFPILTSDVTTTGGSLATTIAGHAVSNAKFRQSAALSVVGNGTNAVADITDLAGTADQVLRVNTAGNALAFGTVVTGGITNSAVTYGKIQNAVANNVLLGNVAGANQPYAEQNAAAVKTMLNLTGTNSGDVTLAGENYLSLSGQQITANAINLSGTNVTSTLPIARGGTNSGTALGGTARPVVTTATAIVENNATISNNTIAKWSGSNFANSSLTDDGTNVSTTENILLSTAGKQLSFQGTGSGVSTLQAGAQAANTYNYTFPITTPTANQVLTATAVSGATPFAVTLGWTSSLTSSSGVQYNLVGPQNTASISGGTNYLYNVAYAALASTDNALGAQIASASGTGNVTNATGLTINTTAGLTGIANGIVLNTTATGAGTLIDITSPNGAPGKALTIQPGAGTAATNIGGALNINGGTGNTSGNGGAVTLKGGTPGTTGTGGAATLSGGPGGTTSGGGGAVSITGGTATGPASAGGAISLTSGNGGTTGASNGGNITITTGNGGSTAGVPGNFSVQAGTPGAAGITGGTVSLTAGQGGSTSAGGTVSVTGGLGGSASGTGGALIIAGGATPNPSASNGGNVTVQGGDPFNGQGGLLTLRAGNSTSGSGSPASLSGGNASSTIGTGGSVTVAAGTGGGNSGNGGQLNLNAGAAPGGTTGGAGGAVVVTAGAAGGSTGGVGGDISMTAGAAAAGNQNGGSINLLPGAASGSGASGIVLVKTGRELRLNNAANSFGTGFISNASSTVTYTLPATFGNNNDVLTILSGGGSAAPVLTWAAGLTSSTGVQYNLVGPQITADITTAKYLFNVAYAASATTNAALGAQIASTAGTSGAQNATGLTINTTANTTGVANGLVFNTTATGAGTLIDITTPNGNPGKALTIQPGAGTAATNAGGALTLNGGAGNTTGAGGLVTLKGGTAGTTGNGGGVTLTAANGGSTSGNGGNITLNAGTVTSGTAGIVSIATGRLDLAHDYATDEYANATVFANASVNNDVNFDGAGNLFTLMRLGGTAGGNFTITSIAGPTSGKRLTVYNTTGSTMTLTNQALTGTNTNRIITETGGDVTIPTGGSANFFYSASDSRWVLTTTSNNNASSATVNWQLAGNAPTAGYNGTTGSFIGTTNTQPLVLATTNTTTAQPIDFYTNNTVRMRLNAGGFLSVGGTFAPTSPIHVSASNPGSSALYLNNTSSTGYSSIDFLNDGGTTGNVGIGNSGAAAGFANQFYFNISAGTTLPMTFKQQSTEKMGIDVNGNVDITNSLGIGFTSAVPNSTRKLNVAGTAGTVDTRISSLGAATPATTGGVVYADANGDVNRLAAPGTTGQLLSSTTGGTLSWAFPSLFARKTADVTLNASSIALQNDADLKLTLAANATYEFSGVVAYNGSNVNSDLQLAFTFNGTLTSMRWSANDGHTSNAPNSVTGSGAAISSFHADGVPANALSIFIRGVIVVGGTGGTLQLQEASNTNQVNTTTILTNSQLSATRVQ